MQLFYFVCFKSCYCLFVRAISEFNCFACLTIPSFIFASTSFHIFLLRITIDFGYIDIAAILIFIKLFHIFIQTVTGLLQIQKVIVYLPIFIQSVFQLSIDI